MNTGAQIVDLARQFIGKVKYVFGASTENLPKGTGDCSSFTQYIMRENGYTIPRTCTEVWQAGFPSVARNELKLGDLVFFTGTYNSVGIASHIGIYSGNDNFIHLANKGLMESSLNESYWSAHYLGARRIAESEGDTSGLIFVDDNDENADSDIGLKWWGDIVKIVLCVLLVIIGVVMLVMSAKGTFFDSIIGG